MEFSKSFIRFNWIALVLIYLIVIAGSLVRITGSGMGCPDWPKCFGQWIPPTDSSELSDDYQNYFSEKRVEKIEKFSKLLSAFGMNSTAQKLKNDPQLAIEEEFNARKTWTEYGNRLVGFLAGNVMLISFFWLLLKYRQHRKIILLAGLNLILMGFEGWFGSIVVASNLVPWTITVHLFFALVIIALQIYIIRLISPVQQNNLQISKMMRGLMLIIFIITFIQLFLGTQVRESIDELVKAGFTRKEWINLLGLPFYIHRSFSWLVLILLTYVFWKNEKSQKIKIIRWTFYMLVLGLISGVLLAYIDMPGLVQTSHLIFATVLFGILTMVIFRTRSATSVTSI
jgi:cytochrome c oxidase assembly protein subunit 15